MSRFKWIAALQRLIKLPNDPLFSPVAHNPALSPHIAEAIMQAMAVKQADRYASADIFKRALLALPASTTPVYEPVAEEEPRVRLKKELSPQERQQRAAPPTRRPRQKQKSPRPQRTPKKASPVAPTVVRKSEPKPKAVKEPPAKPKALPKRTAKKASPIVRTVNENEGGERAQKSHLSVSHPTRLSFPKYHRLATPPHSLTNTQDVANIWQDLEPTDRRDAVIHEERWKKDTADGWRLIGASRRGKMHAHKGLYREDAFALGEVAGWHLMVVADGGDSCPLSRVGSQLAAYTALEKMVDVIKSKKNEKFSSQYICQMALKKALRAAWQALEIEAQRRRISMGHLGTTFLAVIHRPSETGAVVGVAQVGDGLVVAELANGKVISLAEPDVGETASVTFFLTSKDWTEWLDRAKVHSLQTPIRLLAAMCDGVADDFIPFEQHLGQLFQALDEKVRVEQRWPEEALLEYLGYEKPGSFDDRTLTLLYRPSA